VPMEAAALPTIVMPTGSTNGTSSFTRAQGSYGYFGFGAAPRWKEPAADPIADAINAAGAAASQLSESVVNAARAVRNLLRELSEDPTVAIEDNGITLEWYKDRHHVAVVAVDGQSISWAVMAGAANPLKGKKPFDSKTLPTEAYAAISAATVS
jgi:hypothetical protein